LARFIAIDWDQQQLHVVEAVVGGGTLRVQRASAWAETEMPAAATSEALGKRLRERLKEARISAAPVVVCLGRDRVILKDIRYPAVPESEEPAIVRFQVVKELTDAAEDSVIDYVPSTENGANGERRAMALVAKREQVAAYQAICKAAGLRLAGIAPRAFGLAACVQRLAGASVLTPAVEPPDAAVAVLAVADHWAEFCVSRSGRVIFARSLALGDGLAGEIRRNLAIYDGQASAHPVKALYVAGLGEHASLREALTDTLDIPVHALDPFGGVERPELPAQKRGAFIGAVGLLHLLGDKKGLPVNFAQPKQPRPPKDPNRKKIVYAAAAAALVLIVFTAFCYAKLSQITQQADGLRQESANLDKDLAGLEETDKRRTVLGEWADSTIVWPDEIYDLTDRIADPTALRITELIVEPLVKTAKDKDKEKAVAKLTIKGVAKTRNDVNLFAAGFTDDKHYEVGPKSTSDNTGADKAEFAFQFTLSGVKVERIPPDQYQRRLPYTPTVDRSREGFGP
jgi:Tfp pilus assembly PilM family ATPase